MDVILILISIVYFAITLVVSFASAGDWWIQNDYARTTTSEAHRAESEREARRAARRFFRAPLWPLMAISGLARMYAESKEPEDR